MTGTEKPLGSVPNRMEEDVLDIYRLMPSHDVERLLSHIAWMEAELKRVEGLQNEAEAEIARLTKQIRDSKPETRSPKPETQIRHSKLALRQSTRTG